MNFRDIAKKLNVSIATVSRVYNGKPGVSGETRRLIEELLIESNYSIKEKSIAADSNIAMITLVLYDGENHKDERNEDYFAGVLLGVEKRAKELGYILNIVHVRYEDFEEYLLASNEIRLSKGVIILASELTAEYNYVLEKCKIPIVAIDNPMKYISYNSVCADSKYGTYKAIEYLKSLGHEKIGLLAPMCPIGGMPIREEAYYKAMNNLGLDIDNKFIVRLDHVLDSALMGMREYLKEITELPTAFFASNDTLGVAAMITLKQYGYKIPDDISIFGFDDANVGNFSEPHLTTFQVDCRKIVRVSVNRLMDIIGGDKYIQHIFVETPLLVKGSTRAINNTNKR